MSSLPKFSALSLIAAFLLCIGCETKPTVKLIPVDNPLPALAAGTLEPSGVDVQPVPTRQARPSYPFELRRGGVAGESVVVFTVFADGHVGDAAVTKSNDVRFADAAVAAVLKWQFRPGEVKGQAVNCRMMVPIVFTLNENL